MEIGDCTTRAGQSQIGLAALRNSTYQSWYTANGRAQLTDGRFTTTLTIEDNDYAPEAGMELLCPIAEGDIDGDGIIDAAVVLLSMIEQTTGRFYTLHAMLGQPDGSYIEAGSVFLGDRVRIESMAVQADWTILVDTVAAGPNDPAMRPSVRVVYTFTLWNDAPQTAAVDLSCPGDLSTRLQQGMQAQVLPGDPNTLWSDWQLVANRSRLAQLPAGTIMTVVDGPQCRNDFTWWQVVTESGALGWTIEGRSGSGPNQTGYYLAPLVGSTPGLSTGELVLTALRPPTCPDGFGSQLMPNLLARVTPGDPSTLWSDWQLSPNRRQLTTLPPGTSVSVLRGPECRNNYTWWEVTTAAGVRGWLAEGRVGEGAYLEPVAASLTAARRTFLETILNGGAWTIPYDEANDVATTLIVEQLPPLRNETFFLTYTQGWLGEDPRAYPPSLAIWRADGSGLQMVGALNADWYTAYHMAASLGGYAVRSVENVVTDGGAFFIIHGLIDNTVPTVDFVRESEFGLVVDFGRTHGIGGDIRGEVHEVGPGQYGYVVVERFRTADSDTGAALYLYALESGTYEQALALTEAGDYTFTFHPHPSQPLYDLTVTVRVADGATQSAQDYFYEEGRYVATPN